jgi:hypothetical protein
MLALVVVILLATRSGSAVAAQVTGVFVTNDSSHPVPVQGTVSNQPLAQANRGTWTR